MLLWYSKTKVEITSIGIRTDTIKSADNLFLTCCALHNMIMDWDDINETIESIYDEEVNHDEGEVVVEMCGSAFSPETDRYSQ
jgi:hypothetical protein